MEPSAVYFTDFRTSFTENRLDKLSRLIVAAGFDKIDFKGKYVAIKLHFGEPGNLSFLRPNYARVLVEEVRKRGGKPFLTDANTLYVGGRKNALDHLDSAYRNGFNPLVTGCHVIIADGLKGTDEVEVPLPDGRYVKRARIARAIMDADIVISLSHFKGHEQTGIGGALKNLGMGCGSRAGKMEMHSAGKPMVERERCVGCHRCEKICAHDAVRFEEKKATINHDRCVGCGRCIGVCLTDAISPQYDEALDIVQAKIAEYAAAVVRGRPCFHINMICEVSPYCDCHGENDVAVIPDLGMLASFDPVALDKASADLCIAARRLPGTVLDGRENTGDLFHDIHPATSWRRAIEEGERMKIGTAGYSLHRI